MNTERTVEQRQPDVEQRLYRQLEADVDMYVLPNLDNANPTRGADHWQKFLEA